MKLFNVSARNNTKEKGSFEEAVEPAMKWLNDNCNPHASIEIDCNSAELKSGEKIHRTDKFIKD